MENNIFKFNICDAAIMLNGSRVSIEDRAIDKNNQPIYLVCFNKNEYKYIYETELKECIN